MLPHLLLAISVGAAAVRAACSTTQQYNPIPNFKEPNACVPNGYFQAQDLGQTTQADLVTKCENQCTSYGSRCQSYVGQLQTAPNGLSTGQCYYYSSPPTQPVTCANYPTVILAEVKDNTNQCFSSSLAVASAFCSSYLSIPVVTTYTATVTPTSTSLSTATTTTTSTSNALSTTSTTSGYISTITMTSTTTVTSTSTTTIPTFTTSGASVGARDIPSVKAQFQRITLARRAAASPSPAPACLNTNSIPASRISSACSCLSVSTSTTKLVSTAATATTTSTTTLTSTSRTLSYTSTTIVTQLGAPTSTTVTVTSTATSTATARPVYSTFKLQRSDTLQYIVQGTTPQDTGTYFLGSSASSGSAFIFDLQSDRTLTDPKDNHVFCPQTPPQQRYVASINRIYVASSGCLHCTIDPATYILACDPSDGQTGFADIDSYVSYVAQPAYQLIAVAPV